MWHGTARRSRPSGTAASSIAVGQCLHRLGQTEPAVAELTRSLALSREIGEDLAAAYALYGLAEVSCDLDDLDQAADVAAAALSLAARSHGLRVSEAGALALLSRLQEVAGDRDAAVSTARKALELQRVTGYQPSRWEAAWLVLDR